jgi:hypothetical protein
VLSTRVGSDLSGRLYYRVWAVAYNFNNSTNERKECKMGLHQTKKLPHNKGNHHRTEETAYKMEEKSSPVIYLTRINNQNIQGVHKTNPAKK